MMKAGLMFVLIHLFEIFQEMVKLIPTIRKDCNDYGRVQTANIFVVDVLEIDDLQQISEKPSSICSQKPRQSIDRIWATVL